MTPLFGDLPGASKSYATRQPLTRSQRSPKLADRASRDLARATKLTDSARTRSNTLLSSPWSTEPSAVPLPSLLPGPLKPLPASPRELDWPDERRGRISKLNHPTEDAFRKTTLKDRVDHVLAGATCVHGHLWEDRPCMTEPCLRCGCAGVAGWQCGKHPENHQVDGQHWLCRECVVAEALDPDQFGEADPAKAMFGTQDARHEREQRYLGIRAAMAIEMRHANVQAARLLEWKDALKERLPEGMGHELDIESNLELQLDEQLKLERYQHERTLQNMYAQYQDALAKAATEADQHEQGALAVQHEQKEKEKQDIRDDLGGQLAAQVAKADQCERDTAAAVARRDVLEKELVVKLDELEDLTDKYEDLGRELRATKAKSEAEMRMVYVQMKRKGGVVWPTKTGKEVARRGSITQALEEATALAQEAKAMQNEIDDKKELDVLRIA